MPELFPSNFSDSLAGMINLTQDNVIGTPEKHDISNLIKKSTCFSLRRDESGCAGWLASHPTGMISIIGRILESLLLYNTPVWIEGDFDDFIMYSGSDFSEQYIKDLEGSVIGFLFFKESDDVVGCIICWYKDSGNNELSNITICPVVQHIDIERFKILDYNLKPSLWDGLCGRQINSKMLLSLKDLHQSISSGINMNFLPGIIEDAGIINNKQNDETWHESYMKISGSIASRLIFFAIGSLSIVILNEENILRAPGYILDVGKNLEWRVNGEILNIPDAQLTPHVTGQVTLKTVVFEETKKG